MAFIKEGMTEREIADYIVSQYAAEVHEVTQGLKGELAGLLRGGLELKVNPDIRAGFRLAAKDGSGYFDCSDEELMQMLLPFFSDFEI